MESTHWIQNLSLPFLCSKSHKQMMVLGMLPKAGLGFGLLRAEGLLPWPLVAESVCYLLTQGFLGDTEYKGIWQNKGYNWTAVCTFSVWIFPALSERAIPKAGSCAGIQARNHLGSGLQPCEEYYLVNLHPGVNTYMSKVTVGARRITFLAFRKLTV